MQTFQINDDKLVVTTSETKDVTKEYTVGEIKKMIAFKEKLIADHQVELIKRKALLDKAEEYGLVVKEKEVVVK